MKKNILRYISYILGNIVINLICGLVVYKSTKNPPFSLIKIFTDYKIWILLLSALLVAYFVVKNETKFNNSVEEIKMAAIARQKGFDGFISKINDLIAREEIGKLNELIVVGKELEKFYKGEK